eukprot:75707-Prymnesium_polylepis.2
MHAALTQPGSDRNVGLKVQPLEEASPSEVEGCQHGYQMGIDERKHLIAICEELLDVVPHLIHRTRELSVNGWTQVRTVPIRLLPNDLERPHLDPVGAKRGNQLAHAWCSGARS